MGQAIEDIFAQTKINQDSPLQIIKLSIYDFIYWWYVISPVTHILRLRRLLTVIDDAFSVTFSISTLFLPWHRDYTFVGYLIGIIMRMLLIVPGTIVLLTTLILYLAFMIFWLLIPVTSTILTIISPLI